MPIRAAALAALLLLPVLQARAQASDEVKIPQEHWSFSGLFGTYDLAAAQRGFQVYSQVCAACHAMHLLHYRDLGGIGLSPEQVKAVAASVQVAALSDDGQPAERPGLPSDPFKSPFPNDKAAAAANGGKVPPDQSLLVNGREDGANYIHALLNGYKDAPDGTKVPDGLYWNEYYPGHLIHMPPPLQDGAVTYADGTKATVDQMSRDAGMFLTWAANPELVQRKRMGVRIALFLALMAGVTYAVKRQIWADVH